MKIDKLSAGRTPGVGVRKRQHCRRRGTTIVEFAIVAPIIFLTLLAIIVGGLGVFRNNQVAALSREGARWAAVHGKQYAQVLGKPLASKQELYNSVIQPRMAGLNPSRLTYDLTWSNNNTSVEVTVSYQWLPEYFFIPITFSSSSEVLTSF